MIPRSADPIVCYEEGAGAQAWSTPFTPAAETELALDDLEVARVVAIERAPDAWRVRGTDKVGTLVLPCGRRLVIRSKVPGIVLLRWLAYNEMLPAITRWLNEPGLEPTGQLHDALVRVFVHELEIISRQHLRRDYVPLRLRQPEIRGRVEFSRLCKHLHRLPTFDQRVRQRSLNTKYNQVLAVALERSRMITLPGQTETWRRLADLSDVWSAMRCDSSDACSAVHEVQWSPPPGYSAGLQIARLILCGAAIASSGGSGGQAFLLSVPWLWEQGLRRMLDDLQVSSGWTSAAADGRTRIWDDPVGQGDSRRWMTADAVVQRDGRRWVLDAKYKRAFGQEGRDDRFQIGAYLVGFDAERGVLVYPTAAHDAGRGRVLLEAKVAGRATRIDSIELPMAHGPESCRTALSRLLFGRDAVSA